MGKTIGRVVCPTCIKNRIDETKAGKRASFEKFNFDVDSFLIVQEAIGGKIAGTGRGYRGSAKGGGFRTLERLTLEQAFNTHQWDDIILTLKNQTIKTARELIRLGIMSKLDI